MSMPLRDDITDRIANRIVRGPFGIHVGLELELAEPDHCRVRLPIERHVTNGADIVHGGATAALIDTAATAAAWATNRANSETRGTTVGFTTHFLAPAREGALVADASVVQRGGTLTILRITVSDEAGQQIATAMATYKLDLRRSEA